MWLPGPKKLHSVGNYREKKGSSLSQQLISSLLLEAESAASILSLLLLLCAADRKEIWGREGWKKRKKGEKKSSQSLRLAKTLVTCFPNSVAQKISLNFGNFSLFFPSFFCGSPQNFPHCARPQTAEFFTLMATFLSLHYSFFFSPTFPCRWSGGAVANPSQTPLGSFHT